MKIFCPHCNKEIVKNTRRHACIFCGKMRYENFMERVSGQNYYGSWRCIDKKKCDEVAKNYK